MPKGNTTDNDVLKSILQATAFSWNGNANVFLALHTADPTSGGNQQSSEATYTSYARVTVARTSGGWTIVGASGSNTALLQFPQCTGGSNVLTHVSIGTVISGAGQLIYVGPLNASLTVSNLIQPQFAAAALSVTES